MSIEIKKKKKKKGFTLVELVAVVAIIGILAAILVPKVTSYMNEAKKVKVIDQGRKVITAIESYNIKRDSGQIEKTSTAGVVTTVNGNPALKDFVSGGGSTDEMNKLGSMNIAQMYQIVEEKADFKVGSDGAFTGMVTASGSSS